ncbi:MAG: hypothetical protein ACR2KV_07575 [Solirubrobacteraceae bacterium]
MTRPPPAETAGWRPSAAPFGFWAVLLGALAGLQAAFGGSTLPVLLQAAAATVSGSISLGLLLASRRQRRRPGRRLAVPELSMPTPLAAISVAAIVSGATIGSWLIIGGVLGLVLAGGGLVREHRAERRARLPATRPESGR